MHVSGGIVSAWPCSCNHVLFSAAISILTVKITCLRRSLHSAAIHTSIAASLHSPKSTHYCTSPSLSVKPLCVAIAWVHCMYLFTLECVRPNVAIYTSKILFTSVILNFKVRSNKFSFPHAHMYTIIAAMFSSMYLHLLPQCTPCHMTSLLVKVSLFSHLHTYTHFNYELYQIIIH